MVSFYGLIFLPGNREETTLCGVEKSTRTDRSPLILTLLTPAPGEGLPCFVMLANMTKTIGNCEFMRIKSEMYYLCIFDDNHYMFVIHKTRMYSIYCTKYARQPCWFRKTFFLIPHTGNT